MMDTMLFKVWTFFHFGVRISFECFPFCIIFLNTVGVPSLKNRALFRKWEIRRRAVL